MNQGSAPVVTGTCRYPRPTSLARALRALWALTLFGCGAGLENRPSGDESAVVSEALPIPDYEEEAVSSEETAPPDVESTCSLDVEAPPVLEQVGLFRRWLQDQSFGRHLSIDDLRPLCGEREGFVILEVSLNGPAGGLQSLSRALPLYYPGASWEARGYTRLEGENVPLRLTVEVRLPAGMQPRPRCTWDPDTPCPPGFTPEARPEQPSEVAEEEVAEDR